MSEGDLDIQIRAERRGWPDTVWMPGERRWNDRPWKWLGRILWFLAGALTCYAWFAVKLGEWRMVWFL